jgi:hypothetical protein
MGRGNGIARERLTGSTRTRSSSDVGDEWRAAGFNSSEALQWQQEGFDVEEASEWSQADFEPDAAGAYRAQGLTPAQATLEVWA